MHTEMNEAPAAPRSLVSSAQEQPGAGPEPVSASGDETASIARLAAALAKAQGQMKAALKRSENPDFRSRYADLAAVLEACRGPLSANELAVMQRVSTGQDEVTVTTLLAHSSGEWVRDRATFPVAQRTPQAFGSAITYARRYSLAALVGVAAEEDDDGNAASAGGRAPEVQRQARQQTTRKPAVDTKKKEADRAKARAKRIWRDAQKRGLDKEGFRTWTAGVLGNAKGSADWTTRDMNALEKALRELKPAAAAGDGSEG